MKREQRVVFGGAFLILLGASVNVVSADVPRPQPVSRYAELWNNSRITSKPPPPEEEDVAAVFEDYALLSVTPLGEDYIVTMKHKKNAAAGKIRIYPSQANEQGFSVKSVKQTNDYMATKVTLLHEGKVGVVEYDEKFLALKKPPAAAADRTNSKAKAKPAPKKATPTPTPATKTTGTNRSLPPGLQAAGLTNNRNAAKPTNTQSSGATTRKPRVRRVPTPPSR